MTQTTLAFGDDVSRQQTVAPSPFLEARETSAMAAVAATPARARKSAELLRLIDAAGSCGLSDPEIERMTGWPRSTICSVRNAVRHLLVPAERRAKSRWGIECVCWRRANEGEMEVRA